MAAEPKVDLFFTPEVAAVLVATALGLVTALIASWYTLKHTRDAEREKNARDLTLAVVDEYHSDDFERNRVSAYALLKQNQGRSISDVVNLQEESVSDLKAVIRYFSRLEALALSGLINEDLLRSLLGNPHIKAWVIALVNNRAEEPGDSPWQYSIEQVSSLAERIG